MAQPFTPGPALGGGGSGFDRDPWVELQVEALQRRCLDTVERAIEMSGLDEAVRQANAQRRMYEEATLRLARLERLVGAHGAIHSADMDLLDGRVTSGRTGLADLHSHLTSQDNHMLHRIRRLELAVLGTQHEHDDEDDGAIAGGGGGAIAGGVSAGGGAIAGGM